MGLLQIAKEKAANAVQIIRTGAREVARRVKTFLGNAYNAVAFRLDPGCENPDETDERLSGGCRAVVSEILGEHPFEQLASLPEEQRRNALLLITEHAAEALGVEVSSVDFCELEGLAGSYSYAKNRIYYNISMLASPMTATEAKEVLDTVFHELRHVYQHQAARSPSRFGRDKLTAGIWRLNFRQYVPFSLNPARYFAQPVEQDARVFALSIVNRF